jgi:CBS domain-containing protein
MMAQEEVGFLPVYEDDRLIGMLTDRDIVLRCVAQGHYGKARVRDAMTKDIKYCYEDEEIDSVLSNMADIQVRRLPVMNREKSLVGVLSLADAAKSWAAAATGKAYSGITRRGGNHAGDRARA